ncbi:MAG: CpsD/CapB family tyrosine-protein kinase [Acidibacillus sp.]|nr:CpsD/CapB family tyrosine-protein kinase [Acidibacillus sp.]
MARNERFEKLVTHLTPKSATSEMYRMLRTNLDFSSLDHPLHSVMVTSTVTGEGKTTTAANLAVVNAQSGKNTIIVDGDLRKPMIHRIFQLSNIKGCTNVLLKQAELLEAIQPTQIPNLDVLTSGPLPPNPADVIGSETMKKLIVSLTDVYDLVIIDSPPVLSVADVKLLSPSIDGILYVVGAGLVTRQALKKAQQSLEMSGARILGTVLNRKKLSKSEQQYYYYGYGN